jgi:hypothetical protein
LWLKVKILAMGTPFLNATRILRSAPKLAIKLRNHFNGCGGKCCLFRVTTSNL